MRSLFLKDCTLGSVPFRLPYTLRGVNLLSKIFQKIRIMRGPPDDFRNSVFGLTEEVEELGILSKLVRSLERLVSLVGPDRSERGNSWRELGIFDLDC